MSEYAKVKNAVAKAIGKAQLESELKIKKDKSLQNIARGLGTSINDTFSITGSFTISLPFKSKNDKIFLRTFHITNGLITDDNGEIYSRQQLEDMKNVSASTTSLPARTSIDKDSNTPRNIESIREKLQRNPILTHVDTEPNFSLVKTALRLQQDPTSTITAHELLVENKAKLHGTTPKQFAEMLKIPEDDLKSINFTQQEITNTLNLKEEVSFLTTKAAIHPRTEVHPVTETMGVTQATETLFWSETHKDWIRLTDEENSGRAHEYNPSNKNQKVSVLPNKSHTDLKADNDITLLRQMIKHKSDNPDDENFIIRENVKREQSLNKRAKEFNINLGDGVSNHTQYNGASAYVGVNPGIDINGGRKDFTKNIDLNEMITPLVRDVTNELEVVFNKDITINKIEKTWEAIKEKVSSNKNGSQRVSVKDKETMSQVRDANRIWSRLQSMTTKVNSGQSLSLGEIHAVTEAFVSKLVPATQPMPHLDVHSSFGDVWASAASLDNMHLIADSLDENVNSKELKETIQQRSYKSKILTSSQVSDAWLEAAITSEAADTMHKRSMGTKKSNNVVTSLGKALKDLELDESSNNDYYKRTSNKEYKNFFIDQLLGVTAVYAKNEILNPLLDTVFGGDSGLMEHTKLLNDAYKTYASLDDTPKKNDTKEVHNNASFDPLVTSLMLGTALVEIDKFSERTVAQNELKMLQLTKYINTHQKEYNKVKSDLFKLVEPMTKSGRTKIKANDIRTKRKRSKISTLGARNANTKHNVLDRTNKVLKSFSKFIRPAFSKMFADAGSEFTKDFIYATRHKNTAMKFGAIGATSALVIGGVSMLWGNIGKAEYTKKQHERVDEDLEYITDNEIPNKNKEFRVNPKRVASNDTVLTKELPRIFQPKEQEPIQQQSHNPMFFPEKARTYGISQVTIPAIADNKHNRKLGGNPQDERQRDDDNYRGNEEERDPRKKRETQEQSFYNQNHQKSKMYLEQQIQQHR